MKVIRILLTILFISTTITSNAQFLKKLKEKAEQKVKHEAERRAQRRVDRKIDKTFDSAENKIDKTVAGKKETKNTEKSSENTTTSSKNKAENAIVSSSDGNTTKMQKNTVNTGQTDFEFTHIYSFEMKPEKGKPMHFNYYLKNNASYLATELPDVKNKMISIMDFENSKMIMLMENGKDKTRMQMKMDFDKVKEETQKDIKISKTGKHKKILGYPCDEYFVEGKDFTSNVWVTNKAGITFPENFKGAGSKKMRNQNNTWMFKMNGIAMEMVITDTSKRKPKTITITCTKLEKSPRVIHITDYKKLM